MFFNETKIPLTEAHKNKTFVLTLQLKNIRQIINHNDQLK